MNNFDEPVKKAETDTEAVEHITRATGLNLSGSLLDRFGEKLASDAAFAQVIRAANVYRGRLGYAPLGPDGWPEVEFIAGPELPAVTPEQVGVYKALKLAVEYNKFLRKLEAEGRSKYTIGELADEVVLPIWKL